MIHDSFSFIKGLFAALSVYISDALIPLYSKRRRLVIAKDVFDKIAAQDMVIRNALVVDYETVCGHAEELISCFK